MDKRKETVERYYPESGKIKPKDLVTAVSTFISKGPWGRDAMLKPLAEIISLGKYVF